MRERLYVRRLEAVRGDGGLELGDGERRLVLGDDWHFVGHIVQLGLALHVGRSQRGHLAFCYVLVLPVIAVHVCRGRLDNVRSHSEAGTDAGPKPRGQSTLHERATYSLSAASFTFFFSSRRDRESTTK